MRLSVSIGLSTLLFFAASCGQAPVPVDSNSGASGQSGNTLPDGHPTGVTHPGLEGIEAGEATFAGTVRLEGDLGTRGGFLYVSVFPDGMRMPMFSRKYDLTSDDSAFRHESDALVVDFELNELYSLGGLVPGVLSCEATYDPDGYVDTKEPERVTQKLIVNAGDTGIALTLKRAAH